VFPKILIANRGEIAVRIMRAVHALGAQAVAVYPPDDRAALHVLRADAAVPLPGQGAAAYLDAAAIVAAARAAGCAAIHPGYGFLSENADLAQRCMDAGVAFIGPPPDTLRLLGDKARARAFAAAHGVAVLPGTQGATTLAEAVAFAATHGAVMCKALAGGGGRGMRAVHDAKGLPEALRQCAAEAQAAFGSDAVYVERLVRQPRHIEVQIIGDGNAVQHLGERDCSVQRRHQKLIEIAPAPALADSLRQRLCQAAVRLAQALHYRSLCTVEFLLDGNDFFFIEANPRLQVEHTVTEEVTGVDLVTAQLRIACGATLEQLGLDAPPAARGCAIQARVNLETLEGDGSVRAASGAVTHFAPPGGPRVRVDSGAYPGWQASPRYDSLVAKVIAHGDDFASAARRAAAALAEFALAPVASNLDLLHAIVSDADFTGGHFDTGYLAAHLPRLLAHRRPQTRPAETAAALPPSGTPPAASVPEGGVGIFAPMSGVLLSVAAEAGAALAAGTPFAVLEAMKMEHLIHMPQALRLQAIVAQPGELLEQGHLLAWGVPVEVAAQAQGGSDSEKGEDWSAEVAEIARRRQIAAQMGGPEKVARQKREGKLTARERIAALVDAGSFAEIGALTAFSRYGADGQPLETLPANMVTGTARLDGRKVALAVDDFTRRGGSGDAAIKAKQVFLEEYAGRMRLPIVRLLDGQSGGGSVKMARDAGFHYLPVNPAWDAVVDNMSLVPVVAAALGPTAGLGAARLVMSHLAILVEGIGQLFTAGPPVVLGGTGELLGKETLGGVAVHRHNGSIERFVPDEASAFAVIRRFLSYLPASVFATPPVLPCSDPAQRSEAWLLGAIPRNPRRPYAIAPILEAIFDAGSVFPYAEYGDSTVTALARLDGHPVGVIASDPMKGAAMSVPGAQAITRLVDLCETFHLPLVSISDQAGVNIGRVAEQQATIRAGARAIAAIYQARVPQAEIIVRRVYGVGGAGIVNRHRANRSWAWPSGDWGSLPARGGIEAAFRAEIEASADHEATIARLAAELQALSSPFRTAERFGVQDLIDPRDSRALLCDWVRDAYCVLPELLGRPASGCRP